MPGLAKNTTRDRRSIYNPLLVDVSVKGIGAPEKELKPLTSAFGGQRITYLAGLDFSKHTEIVVLFLAAMKRIIPHDADLLENGDGWNKIGAIHKQCLYQVLTVRNQLIRRHLLIESRPSCQSST